MKGKGASGGPGGGRETQFELRTGLTPTGSLLGLVGLGVAIWLVQYGLGNVKAYPLSGGTDGTILFVLVPTLVGILVALVVLFTTLSNLGVTITVRREGLRYAGREIFFDANWGRFTYLGPSHGVKGFRSIYLGNRETRVRVDELFLPDFERLVGFLEDLMARIERGARTV